MISKLITIFHEKRKSRRFYEQFDAFLENPEGIQQYVVENISENGCFVDVPKAFYPNQIIRIRIVLPRQYGGKEIRFNGEFIFSIDRGLANQMDTSSGIGIRVVDFLNHDDKQYFERLLSDLSESDRVIDHIE